MTKKNSALNAAVQILKETGEPLHCNQITERILASGLWQTEGKTPAATLSAQLSTELKKKGPASRFIKTAPGIYDLNVNVKPASKATPTPTSKKMAKHLSFTDAAERILEESEGKPMHYRELTEKALEQDLFYTEGKTPWATLYAQVLTEIKRRKRRGEAQRFVMLGEGMISIIRWRKKGISSQIEEANKKARVEYLKRLKLMKPDEFEEIIGRLLAAIGFDEVNVTTSSHDKGIDVRGTLVVGDVVRTQLAVQVKRWKKNIQAPTVQQVRGSLGVHEQGLIITTSDFSKGAKVEASQPDKTPIGLMSGEQLVALLIENGIGAQLTTLQMVELDEAENEPK